MTLRETAAILDPMSLIQLKVTKGSGQGDTVSYRRPGREEVLQVAPRNGLVPQALVHFVVEKLFPLTGVIRLMSRAGLASNWSEREETEARQAEALTEVFESELWGTLVRNDEFVAMVALICENQQVAPLVPSVEQIAEGRNLLRELQNRWGQIPPGQSLDLTLED